MPVLASLVAVASGCGARRPPPISKAGILVSGQECEQAKAWAGAVAFEVYVDPSDRTRAAVSRQFIQDFLKPLESPEMLRRLGWRCAFEIVNAIGKIGDEQLGPALSSLGARYRELRSRHQRQYTGPSLSADPTYEMLLAGDAMCEPGRLMTGPPGFLRRSREEALGSSPTAANFSSEDSAEAERLAQLFAGKATRLERLDLALGLGREAESLGGIRARESARNWAIRAITLDLDPRRWDPVEIAHLLLVARRSSTACGGEHCEPEFALFLRALSPMGCQFTRDLTHPELPNDAMWGCESGFPFQHELYQWQYLQDPEHAARNGSFPVIDALAPHPDVRAIRKELARMGAEVKE